MGQSVELLCKRVMGFIHVNTLVIRAAETVNILLAMGVIERSPEDFLSNRPARNLGHTVTLSSSAHVRLLIARAAE